MAKPAVTTPPGELMYMSICFLGFSASRNSSWAQTSAAMPSSIGPLTKTIRSRSSREKMSNARSPRLDSSTTIGTRLLVKVMPPSSSGARAADAGSARGLNASTVAA